MFFLGKTVLCGFSAFVPLLSKAQTRAKAHSQGLKALAAEHARAGGLTPLHAAKAARRDLFFLLADASCRRPLDFLAPWVDGGLDGFVGCG